jgi:hypothetical protein
MNLFRALLISFIVSLLSSCGSIYGTAYSYQPPKSASGKMCVEQCVKTKNHCQQSCRMQDQSCRMTEHKHAYYRFQQYRNQQTALGKPVKKSVNDFDNSYFQCNVTCHCPIEFNSCYQRCGGIVTQHQECTAFCR